MSQLNSLAYFSSIITLSLLSSCNIQKSSFKQQNADKILAFMGGEYQSALNESKKLILTWKTSDESGLDVLKYAVWERKSGEQVYSGTAIRGKVTWLAEMYLEVHDYPGIIDDENPLYRYKIDLENKKKTALREENKF